MRVLLTGASGFVGSATLAALLRADADVIAVSRRKPVVSGDYEWIGVDLLGEPNLAKIIANARPDVVLHLAWVVEHGTFWTSPDNLRWVGATLALARAAAQGGVRRFVGVGTCYEYAWPDAGPCHETTTPVVPSLLYGVSKDAVRRVLEAFCSQNGMACAWARLFFLYGAGENPARLIPSVASALAAGKPALCSSGRGIRDFIDVRDGGAALAALALSEIIGAVNIGTGYAISIADVALKMGQLAGRPELIRLGALPDRAGEPPMIVADTTRLRDEVGFSTRRSLDEGLADALRYWAERS